MNTEKIRSAVTRAAGAGAELVVVPECALCGYLPAADLDFKQLRAGQRRLCQGPLGASVGDYSGFHVQRAHVRSEEEG